MRTRHRAELFPSFGERDVHPVLAALLACEQELQAESRLARPGVAFDQVQAVWRQPTAEDVVQAGDPRLDKPRIVYLAILTQGFLARAGIGSTRVGASGAVFSVLPPGTSHAIDGQSGPQDGWPPVTSPQWSTPTCLPPVYPDDGAGPVLCLSPAPKWLWTSQRNPPGDSV